MFTFSYCKLKHYNSGDFVELKIDFLIKNKNNFYPA